MSVAIVFEEEVKGNDEPKTLSDLCELLINRAHWLDKGCGAAQGRGL
jgi:hypothetical protein